MLYFVVFLRTVLITFTHLLIHTWKLLNTATVWSAEFRLGAPLRGQWGVITIFTSSGIEPTTPQSQTLFWNIQATTAPPPMLMCDGQNMMFFKKYETFLDT